MDSWNVLPKLKTEKVCSIKVVKQSKIDCVDELERIITSIPTVWISFLLSFWVQEVGEGCNHLRMSFLGAFFLLNMAEFWSRVEVRVRRGGGNVVMVV